MRSRVAVLLYICGKLDHNLRSSHSGGWVLHILHDYLTNGEVGEGVSQGGWLLMG